MKRGMDSLLGTIKSKIEITSKINELDKAFNDLKADSSVMKYLDFLALLSNLEGMEEYKGLMELFNKNIVSQFNTESPAYIEFATNTNPIANKYIKFNNVLWDEFSMRPNKIIAAEGYIRGDLIKYNYTGKEDLSGCGSKVKGVLEMGLDYLQLGDLLLYNFALISKPSVVDELISVIKDFLKDSNENANDIFRGLQERMSKVFASEKAETVDKNKEISVLKEKISLVEREKKNIIEKNIEFMKSQPFEGGLAEIVLTYNNALEHILQVDLATLEGKRAYIVFAEYMDLIFLDTRDEKKGDDNYDKIIIFNGVINSFKTSEINALNLEDLVRIWKMFWNRTDKIIEEKGKYFIKSVVEYITSEKEDQLKLQYELFSDRKRVILNIGEQEHDKKQLEEKGKKIEFLGMYLRDRFKKENLDLLFEKAKFPIDFKEEIKVEIIEPSPTEKLLVELEEAEKKLEFIMDQYPTTLDMIRKHPQRTFKSKQEAIDMVINPVEEFCKKQIELIEKSNLSDISILKYKKKYEDMISEKKKAFAEQAEKLKKNSSDVLKALLAKIPYGELLVPGSKSDIQNRSVAERIVEAGNAILAKFSEVFVAPIEGLGTWHNKADVQEILNGVKVKMDTAMHVIIKNNKVNEITKKHEEDEKPHKELIDNFESNLAKLRDYTQSAETAKLLVDDMIKLHSFYEKEIKKIQESEVRDAMMPSEKYYMMQADLIEKEIESRKEIIKEHTILTIKDLINGLENGNLLLDGHPEKWNYETAEKAKSAGNAVLKNLLKYSRDKAKSSEIKVFDAKEMRAWEGKIHVVIGNANKIINNRREEIIKEDESDLLSVLMGSLNNENTIKVEKEMQKNKVEMNKIFNASDYKEIVELTNNLKEIENLGKMDMNNVAEDKADKQNMKIRKMKEEAKVISDILDNLESIKTQNQENSKNKTVLSAVLAKLEKTRDFIINTKRLMGRAEDLKKVISEKSKKVIKEMKKTMAATNIEIYKMIQKMKIKTPAEAGVKVTPNVKRIYIENKLAVIEFGDLDETMMKIRAKKRLESINDDVIKSLKNKYPNYYIILI